MHIHYMIVREWVSLETGRLTDKMSYHIKSGINNC